MQMVSADKREMMMIAQQLAGNGAIWLDEHYPGWADHVDASNLDMGSPREDVLGQIAEWASDGAGDSYDWWKMSSRPHGRMLRENDYRTVVCTCLQSEGCNFGDEGEYDEDHEHYMNGASWLGFEDGGPTTYRCLTAAWAEELRDRGVAIPAPTPEREPF